MILLTFEHVYGKECLIVGLNIDNESLVDYICRVVLLCVCEWGQNSRVQYNNEMARQCSTVPPLYCPVLCSTHCSMADHRRSGETTTRC